MARITDWGAAILASFIAAVGQLLAFIPKLIGFIVVFIIGLIVAKLVQKGIVWLLRKAHFEAMGDRIGLTRLEERMNMRVNVVDILGVIVFWFVFLIFLVPAVDALGLAGVSALLGQIVGYIPNVFVAVLVLFLGTLIATFAADVIRGLITGTSFGNPNIYANIVRYAILGFAALIALYQLNIAPAIIETLFTAIVGAMALAVGLAFGLGGRESAQRWLNRGEVHFTNASSQLSDQSSTNQGTAGMGTARTAAAMPTDEQLRNRTFSQQPYSGDQPRRP